MKIESLSGAITLAYSNISGGVGDSGRMRRSDDDVAGNLATSAHDRARSDVLPDIIITPPEGQVCRVVAYQFNIV